jgi:hypothetical protein
MDSRGLSRLHTDREPPRNVRKSEERFFDFMAARTASGSEEQRGHFAQNDNSQKRRTVRMIRKEGTAGEISYSRRQKQ